MIWTGYKAQMAVAIGTVILRMISLFPVTGYAIHCLLRTKSSKSTIKRTMKTANWWQRVTRTCFWNAKCSRITQLRFLIVLRSAAVITWPIPMIVTLLTRIWGELEETFRWLLWPVLFFDVGLGSILAYIMRYHEYMAKKRKEDKKRKGNNQSSKGLNVPTGVERWKSGR